MRHESNINEERGGVSLRPSVFHSIAASTFRGYR